MQCFRGILATVGLKLCSEIGVPVLRPLERKYKLEFHKKNPIWKVFSKMVTFSDFELVLAHFEIRR